MSDKKPTVTKSELVYDLSEKTDLNKTEVNKVLNALEELVYKAVSSNKSITIPGLVKIYTHKKDATPARQMRNPATGETVNVGPKPARKVIKVKAIKNLKDML
jgi:nucleoid DNA-binding protein